MARAKRKKTRRRQPARRAKRRAVATAPATAPRPAAAEATLLELARALSALPEAAGAPREAVTRALVALEAAFHPEAALPRALAQARIGALGNKTRALAVSWAREQLRLGLADILERAAARGELRVALDPEPLAWFVLAACEALGDEPPQAAPDRIRLLEEWLTGRRDGA
jgi:hypothetical protein